MNRSSPHVFVLSGKSGAGKTALCIATVALLQRAGLVVAGLVSPARFDGGRKTGIVVQDIRSGGRRLLAERGDHDGLGWRFDPDALQWGSDVLQAATPCDVLVVDELGPLELKHNKGWTVACDVLDARNFLVALIVVRPSLIQTLKQRLRGHDLAAIPVTESSPSAETLSNAVLSRLAREKHEN